MRDRKTYLGGADVACIYGMGFKTPFELWMQKRGETEDTEPSVKMRLGNYLEDFIINDYEEKFSVEVVRRQEFLQDPVFEHFGGTIDGIANDILIDAKVHTGYNFDDDVLPYKYQLQAHWYMMLAGLNLSHFHVLHTASGVFKTYVVESNHELVVQMRADANNFWELVQNGKPPEFSDSDSIQKWLSSHKEKIDDMYADEELLMNILAYKTSMDIKNEAEKDAARYKKLITESFGVIPDRVLDSNGIEVLRITKTKDGKPHSLKVL